MKIVLWLVLLIPLINLAQTTYHTSFLDSIPIDKTSQLVKYEGIEKVAGSKDEIYNKTKQWLAQQFISTAYLTLTEDRGSGFITGRVIVPYKYVMYYSENQAKNNSGEAYLTINIYSKKNACKYIISDIGLKDGFSQNVIPWSKVYMENLLSNQNFSKTGHSMFGQINLVINNIIASLKNSINEKI